MEHQTPAVGVDFFSNFSMLTVVPLHWIVRWPKLFLAGQLSTLIPDGDNYLLSIRDHRLTQLPSNHLSTMTMKILCNTCISMLYCLIKPATSIKSSWNWTFFSLNVSHKDVIKWKHFLCYWPFWGRIHRSPMNSPHNCQWRGALMLSLTCARTNCWANNGDAGDVRRYRAHYDITVINLK